MFQPNPQKYWFQAFPVLLANLQWSSTYFDNFRESKRLKTKSFMLQLDSCDVEFMKQETNSNSSFFVGAFSLLKPSSTNHEISYSLL